MEPTVKPLVQLLELNEDLLLNCLEGVSEADARARPLPGANSIAFVAVHVVDARHFMARLLGQPIENPLQATLGEARTIEEVTTFPAVGELRAMWTGVARHVLRCLDSASAELLARPCGQPFPMGDATTVAALAFLAQHESYHLGQIALLRRGLGYPAMSYERRRPTTP